MALFERRPALEGLTKDEQKRLDSLTPRVTELTRPPRRLTEGAAQIEVLREVAAAEPGNFLWPLVMGWQAARLRHFTVAIDSFNEAVSRDGKQVRSLSAAGYAYLHAGMAQQSGGSGVTAEQVPVDMSIEALYREAERCFAGAISVTKDAVELKQLHEAAETVDKALARSVKHA